MNDTKTRYRQVISCLSPPLKEVFSAREERLAPVIREIRLRAERPVCVISSAGRFCFTHNGMLTPFLTDSLICAHTEDLRHTMQAICDYSLYSRQNEIISGYVTLNGGHRAGISGTAVINGGAITNIRDLSSINLRIAGEYIGCAEPLRRMVKDIRAGLLICGAPCSGKTTLLRDLGRLLSLEASVSLIDERGELAACVHGVPQNDIGLCDVFSSYPKAQAMEQAIRSMSPDYLICDELGGGELSALEDCVRCGASVIATLHARNADELKSRSSARRLLATGAFSTIVFLEGAGQAGRVSSCIGSGDILAA